MEVRKRNRRFRALTALVVVAALVAVTSACERQARVPDSDYEGGEQKGADEWVIETQDAIYRVNWFTTTDSTIVIMDAQWKELKSSYYRYPANAVTRVANPEIPIVLLRKDVVSVSHVELSKSRTALALGGVAVVVAALVFLIIGIASFPATSS